MILDLPPKLAYSVLRDWPLYNAGNLYITDRNYIRRVTPQGIISIFAGGGLPGAIGDGKMATEGTLNNPLGLALDASGNLYIADTLNHRVRVVLANSPSIQAQPISLSLSANSGGAPVSQPITVLSPITGVEFTVTASSSPSWLSADVSSGSTPPSDPDHG